MVHQYMMTLYFCSYLRSKIPRNNAFYLHCMHDTINDIYYVVAAGSIPGRQPKSFSCGINETHMIFKMKSIFVLVIIIIKFLN